jgi:hypothetical protein
MADSLADRGRVACIRSHFGQCSGIRLIRIERDGGNLFVEIYFCDRDSGCSFQRFLDCDRTQKANRWCFKVRGLAQADSGEQAGRTK